MSMYTIFVGNCSGASRRELEDEFRQFGKIMHIALHKTYAFVDFDSKDAADDAIRVKHHSLFRGKPLSKKITISPPTISFHNVSILILVIMTKVPCILLNLATTVP
ncbi:RNA-binding protein 4.1-like [Convolutriloba macropyga]|uniref:RNA-binding protein 4.1-like n=1 Tax=Convolutriloba macropyga TaxID=536237 RepID=UPI003F52796A